MAATIRIEIASSSTGGGLRDAAKDIRDLDQAARGSTGGFSALSGAAAAAAGAIAASMAGMAVGAIGSFVSDSVSAAGDFEAAVNNLAAVSGTALADAGFSFDDVSAKALQLGQDTRYSASESITAMTELVKGGIPIAEVMDKATDATLNLASAAGVDLTNAAEIVAKQYGVWAETGVDATQITDALTQAANASTVGVEDLALGLAQAGGTAKTAGVSFGDLTQTMALIAPNFASAADAGTSLKTFISRLIPTTGPATKAMVELGLATEDGKSRFFDAQGAFIGMGAAAELLQQQTSGLSEEQKLLAFNTIFGADAIRAAAAIANAGGEGFAAMGESMAAAGTAASVAAQQNQGFNFAMDSLKGSVETLQITIGTLLLPIITAFINEALIPGVGVAQTFAQALFGNADAFAQLSPQLQQVVAGIQAMIPVVTEIAGQIGANWQPILVAIGGVIAALIVPALASFVAAIAPVVVAIGAAIAIGAALQGAWSSNFGNIQGLTAQAMGAIQGVIQSVLGAVLTFWQQNGSDIVSFAQTAWGQIQQIIGGIVQIIASLVSQVFGGIQEFISKHGDEIQSVLRFAWGSIQNIIQLALNTVQGIVTTVLGIVTGDWQKAGDGIRQIVGGLATFVNEQFSNIKTLVSNIGPGMLSAAQSVGTAIIDGIKNGISAGASAIADAARNAAKSALDAAKNLLGIKSPSSVFAAEVGAPIAEGMALGMLQAAPVAVSAAQNVAGATVGAARSTVINRSFTYAPTITTSSVDLADAATARALARI